MPNSMLGALLVRGGFEAVRGVPVWRDVLMLRLKTACRQGRQRWSKGGRAGERAGRRRQGLEVPGVGEAAGPIAEAAARTVITILVDGSAKVHWPVGRPRLVGELRLPGADRRELVPEPRSDLRGRHEQ